MWEGPQCEEWPGQGVADLLQVSRCSVMSRKMKLRRGKGFRMSEEVNADIQTRKDIF